MRNFQVVVDSEEKDKKENLIEKVEDEKGD